jgi:hypothetical protein
MEREGHEHEDERVERLVARLHALDAAAPERLRAAVVEAVAKAAERDGLPVPDATAPGADPAGADAAGSDAAGSNPPRADRAGSGPPGADPADSDPAGSGPGGGVPSAAARRWPRRPRRPLAWAGGAVAALALVALLLVLVLPGGDGAGGGGGAPTVPEVAAVALRAPDGPAPQPADAGRLDVAGDGIPFPDWSSPEAGGWSATGTRSDRVGDRDVTTVVYEDDAGRRVGYAIAERPELPIGGRYVDHRGEHMWVYEVDGATAVMWLRDGRTCVVAGRGVPEEALLDLAAPRGA